MIDPVKVLEHFTNFGQRGHNYEGFPVRCFARYRFDDDYKHWRSFWERSTLKEETFAERNFRDFREFWAYSRKLFPQKILQRLIRESFFSRKKYEKQ